MRENEEAWALERGATQLSVASWNQHADAAGVTGNGQFGRAVYEFSIHLDCGGGGALGHERPKASVKDRKSVV